MGDQVERALEETVPLLRTFRRYKLLSEHELVSLVQKRRDHEYALRRHGAPRSAFLQYAAFERELVDLVEVRGVEHSLPEKRIKSIAGRQAARVNLVYSRAVRKFKGDDALYLHYAKHCIQSGSRKAAARVLARAIAHRGDSERLWIAAVAFRFDTCGDVKGARTLAQRGLRTLRRSKLLWKEYFMLELRYLTKLSARRMSLGLSVPAGQPAPEANDEALCGIADHGSDAMAKGKDGGGNNVQHTCIGSNADGVPGNGGLGPCAKRISFWDGGVPLTVFLNAQKLARLTSLDIVDYVNACLSEPLVPGLLLMRIVDELTDDSSLPHLVHICAEYHAVSCSLRREIALRDGLAALQDVKQLNCTEKSHEEAERCGNKTKTLLAEAERVALKCISAVNNFQRCTSDWRHRATEAVLSDFIGAVEQDLTDKSFSSTVAKCSALLARDERGPEDSHMGGQELLQDIQFSTSPKRWENFLGKDSNAAAVLGQAASQHVRSALRKLTCVPFRSLDLEAICCLWLSWERRLCDLRKAFDEISCFPPQRLETIRVMIGLETSILEDSKGQLGKDDRAGCIEHIRRLYKKAVDTPAAVGDVKLWVAYVRFERDVAKDQTEAVSVQWRSRRELPGELRDELEEQLTLLNYS